MFDTDKLLIDKRTENLNVRRLITNIDASEEEFKEKLKKMRLDSLSRLSDEEKLALMDSASGSGGYKIEIPSLEQESLEIEDPFLELMFKQITRITQGIKKDIKSTGILDLSPEYFPGRHEESSQDPLLSEFLRNGYCVREDRRAPDEIDTLGAIRSMAEEKPFRGGVLLTAFTHKESCMDNFNEVLMMRDFTEARMLTLGGIGRASYPHIPIRIRATNASSFPLLALMSMYSPESNSIKRFDKYLIHQAEHKHVRRSLPSRSTPAMLRSF